MHPNSALEEGFQRVKLRFLQKLQAWAPALDQIALQLQEGPVDSATLEELCGQVHKISGSAKTFGLPRLNDCAIELEQTLNTQLQSPTPHHKALLASLAQFIELVKMSVTAAAADDTAALTDGERESEAAPPSYEYQVLIADDDDNIGDLLDYSLRVENCKILRAKDGKAAVDLLASMANAGAVNIDLIVLDVNMPKMDGFAVLKAIKSSAYTSSIPVIMLTRRDEDESIIQGISSGALDYILKPFQIGDLVARIRKSLKHRRTTILIADDDELVRELLSQRFQRMGYTVLCEADGIGAWQRLQKSKPDLALLDIMMPGMDGFAILNKAKNDPTTVGIPIIILTAKGQQENVLLGLEGGAHDYIVKPFDLDELTARVSGTLLRRQKF